MNRGFFDSQGQFVRPDAVVRLKLPIGFATADAAPLWTVPDGVTLAIERVFWQVTANFTGGSSSAIGVSASVAPHTTDGDLLGGGTGDVAATLVAAGGYIGGTIGASFGTNGVVVLGPGVQILFNRITSAFTAGAGFVHVLARQIEG